MMSATMTQAPAHPLLSKHRIEALSDGVFAIAMTLLVLEIKVPDLPRHAPSSAIWQGLGSQWAVIFAFVMTFVLAAVFWSSQHMMLNALAHLTAPLLVMNLFLLMFVSLLPFSTAMLGHFVSSPVAIAIYLVNQLAISGGVGAQMLYGLHQKLIAEMDPHRLQRLKARVYAVPVGCVAALGFAAIAPQYAFLGFALVIVAVRLWVKRGARPAPEPRRS